MKKNIFTVFVISMMTCFLITCTLALADESAKESDQTQKSEDSIAEVSTPGQLTDASEPDLKLPNDITNGQKSEVPTSSPKDNIDGVELSVAQIIEKAEQGDVYSQYDLALMYFDGKDVPQNMDQATSLLLEAANRGHLRAQQYLASLYESGSLGFPKDKDKAEYWSKLRGRLPSSITENLGQADGSKKGIAFSGFALFAVFIVFALIAIAFIINKKKIKTIEPAKAETMTLDALESQSDSEPESEITLDDLSDS